VRKLFILSGAGLSAESGIPVFRGSGGVWEEHDIMQVCSIQYWRQNRDLVTRFYDERRIELKDKIPNRAHYAIARLQKRFKGRIWNMTQNVDDLLERAGCEDVIHLHGTLRDLRCESCGNCWDIGYRAQNEGDSCPACGSFSVRHNVVMFGEPAPAYRFIKRAMDESALFVAIGTSGEVLDIVMIASEFDRSILIDPNRKMYVTSFGSHDRYIDEYFEIFLQKKAGEAAEELEELVAAFFQAEDETSPSSR